MSRENSFEYKYSSSEREEAERIREKYAASERGRLGEHGLFEEMCKLDREVRRKSVAPAIVLGIVGTLCLGLGMSLVMTDLGGGGATACAIGIGLGVLGIALCALAYPLHRVLCSRLEKRMGPRILELCDRLRESRERK